MEKPCGELRTTDSKVSIAVNLRCLADILVAPVLTLTELGMALPWISLIEKDLFSE